MLAGRGNEQQWHVIKRKNALYKYGTRTRREERGGAREREWGRESARGGETQGHCSIAQVHFSKIDNRMKGMLFISTEREGGGWEDKTGNKNIKLLNKLRQLICDCGIERELGKGKMV